MPGGEQGAGGLFNWFLPDYYDHGLRGEICVEFKCDPDAQFLKKSLDSDSIRISFVLNECCETNWERHPNDHVFEYWRSFPSRDRGKSIPELTSVAGGFGSAVCGPDVNFGLSRRGL